jgi:hypothetical protein
MYSTWYSAVLLCGQTKVNQLTYSTVPKPAAHTRTGRHSKHQCNKCFCTNLYLGRKYEAQVIKYIGPPSPKEMHQNKIYKYTMYKVSTLFPFTSTIPKNHLWSIKHLPHIAAFRLCFHCHIIIITNYKTNLVVKH